MPVARSRRVDLDTLADPADSSVLRPVIQRCTAWAVLDTGHASDKTIIDMAGPRRG
ncbi:MULTISPECIES: hypothetical protein [Nocardia]|uniref:hypothetical protein n=1 Tax=Nocardia TaxID=1817 RepID=UPI001300570E|nr:MULTISPECIES: hypothetical protein [Nocardia]